jgi:hypothetical protein
MGLPWVRLDTSFAHNPKIMALCAAGKWRSAFVYVASLAYAGAHGTDGLIPEYCLPLIHATKQNGRDLVEAGLWVKDVGGWCINDWEEFQLCDQAAKDRSNKARRAALKRWHPEVIEGGA